MKSLKGSKTEKNLKDAVAGESLRFSDRPQKVRPAMRTAISNTWNRSAIRPPACR
jgi:hypothetical protein